MEEKRCCKKCAHETGKKKVPIVALLMDDLNQAARDNEFRIIFNEVQENVHEIAKSKGWWETDRNDGELMCLMHSELSEGFEYLRKGNGQSDHIPAFKGIEEELADTVIRIMDFAQKRGYRVADAIIAKAEFNKSRPYKHGKKF